MRTLSYTPAITTDDFIRNRWVIDWNFLTRGLSPRTVCEVGVGPHHISALPWFSVGRNCQRLIGVEPHPDYQRWARMIPHAEIIPAAIGPEDGAAHLILNEGSSFIAGNWSPTPAPEGAPVIVVDVITFDQVDDGEIDVLNLDCEGGEIHTLAAMRSRPKLIGIELWKGNPQRHDCLQWLMSNGYELCLTTGPEGETMIWRRA